MKTSEKIKKDLHFMENSAIVYKMILLICKSGRKSTLVCGLRMTERDVRQRKKDFSWENIRITNRERNSSLLRY